MFVAPRRVRNYHWRMIAFAGSVAESCWAGDDIDPYEWEDPERMSETDWQTAGCKPGEIHHKRYFDAIEKVGALLGRDGPLWPNLTREARRLIINSRRI
jgi:hypothetical protein